MTAPDLGVGVVHRYLESHRGRAVDATQSAIDLACLDELAEAVDRVARRLLAGMKGPALVAALLGARRGTLQFFDGLYVDLHHLAGNLAEGYVTARTTTCMFTCCSAFGPGARGRGPRR
jgi:L-alanine-DL-glutamate epimerase-like enolase superfamily enzyme